MPPLPAASESLSVQAFLDAATCITRADSAEHFYDALRQSYLALHRRLTNDPDGTESDALRSAFRAARSNPALRVALQLCAMPLYEKPVLPTEEGAPPEFLWLFALPMVVRFGPQRPGRGPLVWPGDALPAEELLAHLQGGGRLEPRAQLGLFASLYTRADLLAWGPENLALRAVNAELSEVPAPPPLPVPFSGHMSAFRSALFFALGVARLPFGVKQLVLPRHDSADLLTMQECLAARLRALGADVQAVQVEPPCPVTSCCLLTLPGFLRQVADNGAHARRLGATHACVRFPVPGYLEMSARLPGGAELPLLLPEPCGEPPAAVQGVLEAVLRSAGLVVEAVEALQTPAPPTWQ